MKLFSNILHKNSSNPKAQVGHVNFGSKVGNDPFVDWSIILLFTGAVALVLIAFGGYVYVSTQAELNSEGKILPISTTASHFDEKKLAKAIAAFDDREKERVILGRTYNGPSDPSLP